MGWKVINNSEQFSRPHSVSGKCPKNGNIEATITVSSVARNGSKNDLQKTYHEASFTCSLLDGTPEASFSPCMKTCPLRPEHYL